MREIAPDLVKSLILKKTFIKKIEGINISNLYANILSAFLLPEPKPRIIKFILKTLFKSLRVQNERRACFFRTFFFWRFVWIEYTLRGQQLFII